MVSANNDAMRYHDWWNVWALGAISLWTMRLLVSPEITPAESWFWLLTCMFYIALDFLWVWWWPHSVKSPKGILCHHVLTMCLMCVPLFDNTMIKYAVADMVIECNTWLLIVRRMIPTTSVVVSRLVEASFLISWVLIRNLWYPYLLWVFWIDEGSGYAACFQAIIVVLQFHWTWNLFKSKLNNRDSTDQKHL